MKHIKTIKFALLCLISSFSLASESKKLTHYDLDEEIARTEKLSKKLFEQIIAAEASTVAPLNPTLASDPFIVDIAKDIDKGTTDVFLPKKRQQYKENNIKLRRLKSIKQRIEKNGGQ